MCYLTHIQEYLLETGTYTMKFSCYCIYPCSQSRVRTMQEGDGMAPRHDFLLYLISVFVFAAGLNHAPENAEFTQRLTITWRLHVAFVRIFSRELWHTASADDSICLCLAEIVDMNRRRWSLCQSLATAHDSDALCRALSTELTFTSYR